MDNEDTDSNFFSDVLKLCYQGNNRKNFLDRHLLEKIWRMRNYLMMANRCYKTESYFNASIIYGEALDLLSTDPYPDEFKLTDDEQLELKYAYCLALLSSDDADCISKALDYLKDLVIKHGKSCPVFYLSLGSVYYKLTQYDKCVDVLTQGLKYTNGRENKQLSLPFTDQEYLADTNSAELSGKMRDLLADSKIARQPDMKCNYGGCVYAGNIFIDNPTFPGYINIKCSDSCSFNYHLSCWKIKKKIIFNESGKIDILKMECGTPDCEGILCEITVYNGKCNVKSTRKLKVDSKKTVSKEKKNSVLQSPQCGTTSKVKKGAASKTNANDKVTQASQQNKAKEKTKEVACKDDESLPQSVSHENIIALPIPSKISQKTSWTQTKTLCKTVEVQCCSEKVTTGTQTTTANTGKKKFKNCSTNTDAILNISSTGSCKNCKEANKNCKKLESENKQMASELENLKLELQKEKERFAYAQDTSKNIVNNLLEHVKRAQSEQIENAEGEEKQQGRVRFLNNVLVEQIQHNQNVYNSFYTLYKDKCKRMLWDLNDVLQLVRFESVPSKVEIEMSIKHWNHAVSQICNCQNHVMRYFDNLLKLLAMQDSYGEINPQQLPDLPSEPPNLLNSYFKVLVNMNNTILNSITVPIQTQTLPSQAKWLVGLPLTSNQVIMNPSYPNTNFQPNVVRPSTIRYPMSSPVPFPAINKTGGVISSTEPNVPHTSKGIQNSKSGNGAEVNQNEKSSLVTTEEFNEAINVFSTSEGTQMRTKENGTETVCSKDSLNTTTKPDESNNFTTVAQRRKKKGAAVDQNGACSNEKPEASQKESEQISRSEKNAQVSVTLVLSLKKYFPDVPNSKLVEAVTALKNRRNKLSGTRMSEIAEEVKLILMSMVVESYSNKNITNAEQQTWCKIESGLKKWHPENVDLNCSICFEELQSRPTLELLCLHLFHKHCIKQWLQNNSICPICRTYIVLDDEFPPLPK